MSKYIDSGTEHLQSVSKKVCACLKGTDTKPRYNFAISQRHGFIKISCDLCRQVLQELEYNYENITLVFEVYK